MAPDYSRNRNTKDTRESALPLGLWVTLYLRDEIEGRKTWEGSVDYCSTYGTRITTESGIIIYASHANIIGAVGAR